LFVRVGKTGRTGQADGRYEGTIERTEVIPSFHRSVRSA
jgi:hypothetical protein